MKLYYFDIYGRAESLRLLLWHAKAEFEDVRLTPEEFAKKKEEGVFEWGQVPVLEVDGKSLSQSHAILRFLGRKYGYYPTDDIEVAWKIDSALEAIIDLAVAMFKVKNEAEDKKEEAIKAFLTGFLPKWLTIIENRVKNNSSPAHLVGDKWTIADFAFNSVLSSTFFNEGSEYSTKLQEVINNYPALLAYREESLKELGEYFAKRPQPRPL